MRAVNTLFLGLLVCVASAQQQHEVPPVTLQNCKGLNVFLSPIEAAIQSIFVPDCKTGKAVDVVLG
jgi:hypothetical protein